MPRFLSEVFNTIRILRAKKNLGSGGERVDIFYSKMLNYDEFDIYQKSHFKRYEYARELISSSDTGGDFSCGTGYGTVMLAEKSKKVVGADWNEGVIRSVIRRYGSVNNVEFLKLNLLDLDYFEYFDYIISFETIEHFPEPQIRILLSKFQKALKPNGQLIYSIPYKQEKTPDALRAGFHQTFGIDELTMAGWLECANIKPVFFKYQNYLTHEITDNNDIKDFIIGTAIKGT